MVYILPKGVKEIKFNLTMIIAFVGPLSLRLVIWQTCFLFSSNETPY